MIYVFLATGFEDIEAIAPVDIMRRAGLKVQTVSITSEKVVVSAHGVGITADLLLADVDFQEAEMLVLPGGLPGATNLDACKPLTDAIVRHHEAGGPIAAICAAPLVFGHLGVLEGCQATCYPGFETELRGAVCTSAIVEQDGNIITGKGPGAAFEFGYTIVDFFLGEGASLPLRQGMIYAELTEG
ncbi:MAG: DJ-1/PfpI family protein [Bacteroidaceae bacterium]|nr:DJ-1/PfpI family protein [Bacteroidaceae bacterium]